MLELWEAAVLPTCSLQIGHHDALSRANVETSTEKRHVIMCESFNEFMLTAFLFALPLVSFVGLMGERLTIEDRGQHPACKAQTLWNKLIRLKKLLSYHSSLLIEASVSSLAFTPSCEEHPICFLYDFGGWMLLWWCLHWKIVTL